MVSPPLPLAASRTASVGLIGAMVLGVIGVGAVHADPGEPPASTYTVDLLEPTNGGTAAAALGINDRGDVSGITRPTSSAQPQQTVLWEWHGDHFDARALANLDGSRFSRGFDVSAERTIVGEAFNSGGNSIPVRWGAEGDPEHVTSLNDAGTGILTDISEGGVAVGVASSRAVVLTPEGEASVLPAPDAGVDGATVTSYTATTATGDSGQSGETVAGGRASITFPHGDHTHSRLVGVVWEDGGSRLLETPEGGTSPVVGDVTEAGEAVGSVTVAAKESPIEWDASGRPRVLPTPQIADYTHAAATSTDAGVTVGYASKFAGNTSFGGSAVRWVGEQVVDLNTLVPELPSGVTLQAATDINSLGQIVGRATTTEGARGFVLTPVAPEPVSTTVSGEQVRQIYGRAADLEVSVAPQATGEVSAQLGADVITAELVDGRATLRLPARSLEPGRREVPLTYHGSAGEFAPSTGTAVVTVRKATATLRFTSVDRRVQRGEVASFGLALRSGRVDPSGTVTVRFDGRSRSSVVSPRGRVRVDVPVRRRGETGPARVVAVYRGDPHVSPAKADPVRLRITR